MERSREFGARLRFRQSAIPATEKFRGQPKGHDERYVFGDRGAVIKLRQIGGCLDRADRRSDPKQLDPIVNSGPPLITGGFRRTTTVS